MVRTRPEPATVSEALLPPRQSPIGVFLDPGSDQLTLFANEEEAEAAIPDSAVEATLNSAGMWSDIDWEEMDAALDRIRHESAPSRSFEE